MHSHCHSLIHRLLVLLCSLLILEVIEYVDLPQPQVQFLIPQRLETFIYTSVHFLSLLLTSLKKQCYVFFSYVALQFKHLTRSEQSDLT
jgi:hypothetical protein